MPDGYEIGEPLIVSQTNSVDRGAAANAAAESRLAQEAYHQTLQNAFGAQADGSVSPGRTHTYDGTSEILPVSTLGMKRRRPRTVGVQFTETDGMKCAEGHIPEYKNQIPFDLYSNLPVSVCLKNDPNIYLAWDDDKSKYCCKPTPDDDERIMERSLQNIYNMVTKSDIHYKSIGSLKAAIKKYLRYYDLVNNNDQMLIDETKKMNTLKTNLTRDLSQDYEERGKRVERGGPLLTKAEANKIFNIAYSDVVDGQAPRDGGRSKKHKSKSRTKKPKSGKPKSKSKRTKSRKSKRRY